MTDTHGGRRPGAGAKPKPEALRKVPAAFRLPAWLRAWLVSPERDASAAVLIEEALCWRHGLRPPVTIAKAPIVQPRTDLGP